MTRLRTGCAALLALGFVGACGKDPAKRDVVAPDAGANGSLSADRSNDGNGGDIVNRGRIAIRDDCDPRDPAWNATGGCMLRQGDVNFAEFTAENNSTLALSVIGHMGWRMDPTYLKLTLGRTVRVRNEGGRTHTFTEVAMFGGGKIPDPTLNKGLITAPECPGSVNIPSGGSVEVSGLSVGNHRFQCCIHPWMRVIVKVKAHGDQGDD